MDKSLVKFDASNTVRMHDLIQDMGRAIVRQESISEPGKRSRLWFDEDIVHVLEENTGTDKIEVLVLNLSKDKKVQWCGEAFKQMKRLKVLIIGNADFSTSPNHLPNSLRVLDWSGYPSLSLPSDFHPKKLVILNLPGSCLENFKPLKMFKSLNIMDFEDCKSLKEVPDLSGVPNLGSLCLDNCTNLTRVHASVGFLDKLISLSAKGCTQLLTLVPFIKLTCLEILDLRECLHLESFPEVLGRMDNVRDVYLDHTAITELPMSIGNLIGLERLFLRECKRLHQLPDSIKMLPQLEVKMAFGRTGFRLFQQYGDPEYVSAGVSSSMMFLDIFEFDFMMRLTGRWQRFVKAYTVIMSDNFIQVAVPSKDPSYPSGRCYFIRSFSCDHDGTMIMRTPKYVGGGFDFPLLMYHGFSGHEYFNQCGTGASLSFWFRKKFPGITLVVDGEPDIYMDNSVLYFKLCLLINGKKQFISSCNLILSTSRRWQYTFKCDLVCKAEKVFLEHEWNHVEVSCELKYHRQCDDKLAIAGHHMGTIRSIHVEAHGQHTSVEDLMFEAKGEQGRNALLDEHFLRFVNIRRYSIMMRTHQR